MTSSPTWSMAEGKGERCGYYLQKKKRYCRMTVAKGNQYCGEHLVFAKTSSKGGDHVRRRVPCPLDPKHSVFEDVLEKHLQKCNAGKVATPTCYSLNINSGDAGPEEGGVVDLRPLGEYPQSMIDSLVARVTTAFQKLKSDLTEEVLEHPSMSSKLSDPANGSAALKHLRQQSSIIAHLAKLDLLADKTCFVEFGAGRGKLSQCIQSALPEDISKVEFVLVDRANCRRKVEGSYKASAGVAGAQFHRLLIDIEHLDLAKVDNLSGVDRLVAVSKHLCGAATDFTLRCLVNYRLSCGGQRLKGCGREGDGGKLPAFSGAVIALCCHHRCSWGSLAGREVLASAGFTSHDCHMICHMTSWAVCGRRLDKNGGERCNDSQPLSKKIKLNRDDSHSHFTCSQSSIPIPGAALERDHEAGHASTSYYPHPREDIGLMCKRLLDFARLSYLKENGFDAKLLYFVNRKTSLENVLLVVLPTS